MGTEYFELAKPITRLEVHKDAPLSRVDFWMGRRAGTLTFKVEQLADFMVLFRGKYAGKVSMSESGRVFSPAGGSKPGGRTQLISENGRAVNYADLLAEL